MLCTMCMHGTAVDKLHHCEGCGESLCRHMGKWCPTCRPTPPMTYDHYTRTFKPVPQHDWRWSEATNDEVTRIKTGRNRCGGVKRDGMTYWYDEDGRAVMRWNPEKQVNELRL